MSRAAAQPNVLNDPLVGRRLGRYDVLHRVAGGGMGSVYIGRARALAGFERLVAIKVLHPHLAHEEEFISMFLDEARLAARIRHANVVPTVDVCQTTEAYFLVMEYIEGDHLAGILRESIKQHDPLKPSIVARILLDAIAGLAAAHELTDRQGHALNLVHRDVSPQNILVGSDGIARLTDFGVVKAETRLSSTREGQFKGKLAYMAPEQASHGEVEQRSDVFAMGVVLWEALTGRRLFSGGTNAEVLQLVLHAEIPVVSSIRADLAPYDAVLSKALSRPIEQRYQSAHELHEALEGAAIAAGGVASGRELAEVVRRLAADKLATEAVAIQTAVSRASSVPPAKHLAATRILTKPPDQDGNQTVVETRRTLEGASNPPGALSQPNTLSDASQPNMLSQPRGHLSSPGVPVGSAPGMPIDLSQGAAQPQKPRTAMFAIGAVLILVVGLAVGLFASRYGQGETSATPETAVVTPQPTPQPDPEPTIAQQPTPPAVPTAVEPPPTPIEVATPQEGTTSTGTPADPVRVRDEASTARENRRRITKRGSGGDDVLTNPYRTP